MYCLLCILSLGLWRARSCAAIVCRLGNNFGSRHITARQGRTDGDGTRLEQIRLGIVESLEVNVQRLWKTLGNTLGLQERKCRPIILAGVLEVVLQMGWYYSRNIPLRNLVRKIQNLHWVAVQN
jgi:hypothetical protein